MPLNIKLKSTKTRLVSGLTLTLVGILFANDTCHHRLAASQPESDSSPVAQSHHGEVQPPASSAPPPEHHQNHEQNPQKQPASPASPDSQAPHQGHDFHSPTQSPGAAPILPPMPANLPPWMNNKDTNHIYRRRGPYNDAVYQVPALARDLNAIAVGHALAYEDLVTGRADRLETQTFSKIDWVIQNPPRFMPDEGNISPTFGRRYGVLEQVFDWAHILHAQTVDVLASTDLSNAEKEVEIERLYKFYRESVPYTITGLPMHMGYLDSQPYSQAFRQKYPNVNGLFWGYHWLQGAMYDVLYGKSLEEQRLAYATTGQRYREVELYRRDRRFMPMFAALSPRFAARFPYISNTFDNLHMLHDLVNDILASDWLSEAEKEAQITRAIWLVMDANHQGMKPGEKYGSDDLHDHRFTEGIPGMGLMIGIEGWERGALDHNHLHD